MKRLKVRHIPAKANPDQQQVFRAANVSTFWRPCSEIAASHHYTFDSHINAESVVALLRKLATTFLDLPATPVLDNAHY
jgi:hypothetical protein